ncbi:hypothetical protein chiPu_0019632, partial [Chiloscyllium punctatum]|nr:hypothetical protein [Chiloscyllium punctatum]
MVLLTFMSMQVIEGNQPGNLVTTLQAKDADEGENGTVIYSLAGPWAQLFSLHPTSGELRTATVLYRLERHEYELTALASDRGHPPQTTSLAIRVQVLSSANSLPQSGSNSFTFSSMEGKAPGSIIGSVVSQDQSSRANGQVTYTLVGGTDVDGRFVVDRFTGKIYLAQELDYELGSHYQLEITIDDLSTALPHSTLAIVDINIEDRNEYAPQFAEDPITLVINENAAVGTSIYTFQAVDKDGSGPNSQVQYTLLQQTPPGNFLHIDSMTGTLTAAAVIDRETTPFFLLVVQAMDQTVERSQRKSSAVTVRVFVTDENDNEPQFLSPSVLQVMEDQPISNIISYIVAQDADLGENSRLSYRIKSGLGANKLRLNPTTGALSIVKELDCEEQSWINLTIEASDHGTFRRSATQLLHIQLIDVNDEVPTFDKKLYEASVLENQAAGTQVIKIHATDRDQEGDASGHFQIDRNTGVLSTNSGLDRESVPFYTLTILAEDRGTPQASSTVSVHVTVLDINDNTPAFPESSYTIEIGEDNAVGTVLLEVSATDGDEGSNGDVLYYLSSESQGMFHIDQEGRISTVMSLDREKQPSYTFLVRGVDSAPSDPRSCTARVEVNVKDVNDHSPHFVIDPLIVNISKHTPVNHLVATMKADDKDFGANASIFYRFLRAVSGFTINSFTGEIRLLSPLSSMSQSERTLFVVATDQGSPALSSTGVVMIHLREEHNPGLRFRRSISNIPLAENSAA